MPYCDNLVSFAHPASFLHPTPFESNSILWTPIPASNLPLGSYLEAIKRNWRIFQRLLLKTTFWRLPFFLTTSPPSGFDNENYRPRLARPKPNLPEHIARTSGRFPTNMYVFGKEVLGSETRMHTCLAVKELSTSLFKVQAKVSR
jgi:hypothetical protein